MWRDDFRSPEERNAWLWWMDEAAARAEIGDDGEDWDECGAKPHQQEFLDEVVTWVRAVAAWLMQQKISLGEPTIGPGPDGTIDFYWRCGDSRMLLNYGEGGVVTFYGQVGQAGSDSISQGHFQAMDFAGGPWLWIARNL